MMKLYRAVSKKEKEDFDKERAFKTSRNTLEAKQFFRTKSAIEKFVDRAVLQGYEPPYLYLLTVSVDEIQFLAAHPTLMTLDGFEAVNIEENDLLSFNNSIIFVEEEEL